MQVPLRNSQSQSSEVPEVMDLLCRLGGCRGFAGFHILHNNKAEFCFGVWGSGSGFGVVVCSEVSGLGLGLGLSAKSLDHFCSVPQALRSAPALAAATA